MCRINLTWFHHISSILQHSSLEAPFHPTMSHHVPPATSRMTQLTVRKEAHNARQPVRQLSLRGNSYWRVDPVAFAAVEGEHVLYQYNTSQWLFHIHWLLFPKKRRIERVYMGKHIKTMGREQPTYSSQPLQHWTILFSFNHQVPGETKDFESPRLCLVIHL